MTKDVASNNAFTLEMYMPGPSLILWLFKPVIFSALLQKAALAIYAAINVLLLS